jgi:hypothetical protein
MLASTSAGAVAPATAAPHAPAPIAPPAHLYPAPLPPPSLPQLPPHYPHIYDHSASAPALTAPMPPQPSYYYPPPAPPSLSSDLNKLDPTHRVHFPFYLLSIVFELILFSVATGAPKPASEFILRSNQRAPACPTRRNPTIGMPGDLPSASRLTGILDSQRNQSVGGTST